MHETDLNPPEILPPQLAALSRWDNEGGAGPDGPQAGSCPDGGFDVPVLTNAELVQHNERLPFLLDSRKDEQIGCMQQRRFLRT